MYQVFSGQKPPLDRKDMPDAYGQLIDECWQEDSEERPTFAAILQRLRGMYKDERQRLHNLQLQAGEQPPVSPASLPSPRPPFQGGHSLGSSDALHTQALAQHAAAQQQQVLSQQHHQQQQRQDRLHALEP